MAFHALASISGQSHVDEGFGVQQLVEDVGQVGGVIVPTKFKCGV